MSFLSSFWRELSQRRFVFSLLLRQTLIVLLKSKKDALLIRVGACFSLAQGMTADDGLRENIVCDAQFGLVRLCYSLVF